MKKNTEMKNASMAADSLDMKLYRGFVGSAYGFSGTMLKTFAIIIMVLDHTGAAVNRQAGFSDLLLFHCGGIFPYKKQDALCVQAVPFRPALRVSF